MKMKFALAVIVATGLWAGTGHAAVVWAERWTYQREEDAFPSNQLNLDLFGTFSTHDFGPAAVHNGTGNASTRDRWGAGVGLDYFFNRYMGIGADTYLEDYRWPYRVNGSAILRLPLQAHAAGLAPYIFGGGGRQFKYFPEYTWHGGGGFEFKFNRWTGLFADARYVFATKDDLPDSILARLGISVGF
jgi:hypothetical protein